MQADIGRGKGPEEVDLQSTFSIQSWCIGDKQKRQTIQAFSARGAGKQNRAVATLQAFLLRIDCHRHRAIGHRRLRQDQDTNSLSL